MPNDVFVMAAAAMSFIVISTLAAFYFVGWRQVRVKRGKPRKKGAPLRR